MRIAAFQMQSTCGDIDGNLSRIEAAAHEAAKAGGTLLVAPELCITGYGAGDAIKRLAEPPGGHSVTRLSAVARASGVAIIAGFAERDDDDVFNSAVFVTPGSDPVVYRKSHLYGDYERSLFKPFPPTSCVVELNGLKLGILICYDVEFPENVRRLALAGCSMVVVPTALPAGPSGTFIADHMIQVRAFENQIFVAYVNHAGSDDRFAFAGLSRIAAPDGNLIVRCEDNSETLMFADIDPAAFAHSIESNPYLLDLRR